MTILQDALRYAALGWSIIPIRAGSKAPAAPWKRYQSERASEARLRDWFAPGGHQALAVVCGPVSGNLVCRDFDDLPSYERWAEAHPALATTLPTVATARGRHVYFRTSPAELRTIGRSGGSGIRVLGDGELRGAGYCLLPRSVHPDGPTYCWLVEIDGDVPELDRVGASFLESTESTENTERTESPERTEPTEPLWNGYALSALDAPCSPSALCSLSMGRELDIEGIIERNLPAKKGDRNKCVFEYVRELKSQAALADAPVKELRPLARRWHERALPFIGTLPFEETWHDFAHAWGRVKFVKGKEPIRMHFEQAIALPAPAGVERYEQEKLRLLVALCRQLQQAAGEGPFYLATRTAGELLGIDHSTAAKWLRVLTFDGVLVVVEKGSHESRRASRFRYDGAAMLDG